jgi:hypothetical protein
MQLKTWLLRFGCLFFSSWCYINHDCIITTGRVLKINKIYTYKESGYIDIVRLVDVYIEKGYLYCSLYFFNKNKINTVCQIMQEDAYIIWHLLDNEEFDEIKAQKS